MRTQPGCSPTSALAPVSSSKYIAELDGIRALAVSCVVAAHYGLGFVVPGAFGVTLFFFLSGYLITTLFYAEYKATSCISIPRFYIRRWMRLTPPLLVLVAVAAVFHAESRTAVGGGPIPAGTVMAVLFYYTNYYDLSCHMIAFAVIPFGICWSLAVEEHFYLLWPWLMKHVINRPERGCMIIATSCAGILAWRMIGHHTLHFSNDYTYMASECRIDSILYGALLRMIFETAWAEAAIRVLRSRICQTVAMLALLSSFAIRGEDFRQTIRYTVQGIALMPVFTAILCNEPRSLLRRVLSSEPLVFLGRLSYSVYLFHLVARTPGEVYFGSPFCFGAVVSGLLLTLAISYGNLVLIEQPMARIRHRFREAASPGAMDEGNLQAQHNALHKPRTIDPLAASDRLGAAQAGQ